jgi:hypothetical protein
MITRGELKGNILLKLNKTAKHPGPYTDDKINLAIQEAIDFVATEMFLADEGWLTTFHYYDTVDGQISVDINQSCAMIKEVRYKYGETYYPLVYDTDVNSPNFAADSGARQWSFKYRIMDNAIYFNPPVSEGGTDYLQIEAMEYPKRLQSDQDFLNSQFDKAMQHFIMYRAATILGTNIEKMAIPWSGIEGSWYEKMQAIVVKRNLKSTAVREFQG